MARVGQGEAKNEPAGELVNRSFHSRCPPIVTLDTIVIALCGPNDHDNNASPLNDGWFFSDFYLFHHLFKNTAKEQHWLTCVSPETLVEEYGEYAHGNPSSGDRRVVLDQSMLKDTKDVTVFKPKDLLDRFLSVVASASRGVKGTQRPILILVFGHGTQTLYSITIGGDLVSKNCLTLTRGKFREALVRHNPDANVTMIITSCYGGGWVEDTSMNIGTMAGSDRGTTLLSWPESDSLNRACGSRFASRVAQALMEKEIQGFDLDNEEDQKILESPTYAMLVSVVHETLAKEVDARTDNQISFSAKDDMWGMEWRARIGFLLTSYQEKWNQLRRLENGTAKEKVHSATIRFSDTVNLSTPQAEYRVKHLAYDYFNSCPGPDEVPKNIGVHSNCRSLLKNKPRSDHDTERLAAALRYRLDNIMDQATEYKNRLGIPFKDCRNVDTYNYMGNTSRNDPVLRKHRDIGDMIFFKKLFDEPAEHEGMPYIKGEEYLTIVLLESGWTIEQIEDGLNKLVKLRDQTSRYNLTLNSFKFWEDRKVIDILEALAKSTKRELRHRS